MSVRPEHVLERCREAGAPELAAPLVERDATESELAEVLQRFSSTRDALSELRFDDDDGGEMASLLALYMTDDQARAHLAAIAFRLGRASFEATLPQPETLDLYRRPSGRDNGGSHAHE